MTDEILFLIRRCAEFIPKEKRSILPRARGIYVLMKKGHGDSFHVIYVGMSDSDIHGRLNAHARSSRKGDAWDYFSVFEIWDNIPEDMIRELEGLLRYIYRKDPSANIFNLQGGYKRLRRLRVPIQDWKKG